MKIKVYVRVARSQRFRRGHKVDMSMTYNPEPLTAGSAPYDEPIHTAFFAMTMDVPNELLEPADLPVVDLGHIDITRSSTVTPVVEQADEPESGST